MTNLVRQTFYFVIQAKDPKWPYRGLRTPKVTQNKPTIPKGAVALKIEIAIPASLFEQFIPEGTLTLPEDASIGRPAIEVRVPQGIEVTPDVKLELVPYDEPQHPAD